MWVEQPVFAAVEAQATQREECSPFWSSNSPIARSGTSGENLFVGLLVMSPSELEVGAIGRTGAVQFCCAHNQRYTGVVPPALYRICHV